MLNIAVTALLTDRPLGGRDELRFLRQWLRHPGRIGSVVPSGAALTSALAAAVPHDANGWVVELGAGTGSVTRALLAAGIAPQRLVALDSNAAFADLLRERFPDIAVIAGDACDLGAELRAAGIGPVTAVVSSLPLLSLGARTRRAILSQIADVLAPDGVLVQYTYGPVPPAPRSLAAELGLAGTRATWVLANMPPAAVWRYRRNSETALSRAA